MKLRCRRIVKKKSNTKREKIFCVRNIIEKEREKKKHHKRERVTYIKA